MRRNDIEFLVDKPVKLVKSDFFVIYGTITQLNFDSLVFKDKNDVNSIISFDRILEIVER